MTKSKNDLIAVIHQTTIDNYSAEYRRFVQSQGEQYIGMYVLFLNGRQIKPNEIFKSLTDRISPIDDKLLHDWAQENHPQKSRIVAYIHDSSDAEPTGLYYCDHPD